MQNNFSTVQAFLNGPGVTLAAEQMMNGAAVDWRVEMGSCSALIEEKASSLPFSRQNLHNAAIQLESVTSEQSETYRILWVTNASICTRGNQNLSAQEFFDDEFFQRHLGVDGVVVMELDAMKMRARLSPNPHSKCSSHLLTSPFAARLENARYFPVEFPTDVVPGIVSGAQPKLLLQRNSDGVYSSPRRSAQELKERMDVATDIVSQLCEYFQRKKSEYPDWADDYNLERIGRGLKAKAVDGKWPFTQSEQRWIMARLREFCLPPG